MNRKERRAIKSQRRHANDGHDSKAVENKFMEALEGADSTMSEALLIAHLDIDMNDGGVLYQIGEMTYFRMKEGQNAHILCSIQSFDDDPAELWEIPEARVFAQRLVNLGYLPYLDPVPFGPIAFGRPFSAMELWLLSIGEHSIEGLSKLLPNGDPSYAYRYEKALCIPKSLARAQYHHPDFQRGYADANRKWPA
jgi:hypothetical protein